MYYILSIPGTVGISKFCSKSRYKLLSFPFFHFFFLLFILNP
ncbi:cytochrome c biogenesis protein [Iris pallida]|uniref:Cytochrome c biogenesis protein (Chloroplast) n=1 Tax=Iris pallida TaxID=29817 RepID=A0AAX6GVN0_IRIPA|nr:cytochrome c biogenesis protein [Iris pallida]